MSSHSVFTSISFIAKDYRSFLSTKFWSVAKSLGCRKSNCSWQDAMCSLDSDNSHFPAILPPWCSMDGTNIASTNILPSIVVISLIHARVTVKSFYLLLLIILDIRNECENNFPSCFLESWAVFLFLVNWLHAFECIHGTYIWMNFECIHGNFTMFLVLLLRLGLCLMKNTVFVVQWALLKHFHYFK